MPKFKRSLRLTFVLFSFSIGAMPKRPSWYDPETQTSPLLTAMAELRRACNRAEWTLPHTKAPGSLMLIEAIKAAIDDWAECEMGARDFFYGRGHSAGCKHT
jgi:hypothetical protein